MGRQIRKLLETGIYKLNNGKFQAVVTIKEGKKYVNKQKNFDTIEDARRYRVDIKEGKVQYTSPTRKYTRQLNGNMSPRASRAKVEPVFQQFDLQSLDLQSTNSDSFVLIISKNRNVIDNILAKFL